jgi:hypothetical protein
VVPSAVSASLATGAWLTQPAITNSAARMIVVNQITFIFILFSLKLMLYVKLHRYPVQLWSTIQAF